MATMPMASDAAEPVTRFDALFAQFYPELFGLVYRVLGDRMETEDTLQETFLKLADEPELQLRADAEVAAWLRRVVCPVLSGALRAGISRAGRPNGDGGYASGDLPEACRRARAAAASGCRGRRGAAARRHEPRSE